MCSTISGASGGQEGSLAGCWNLLAESLLTSLAITAGLGGTSSGVPHNMAAPGESELGKWVFWREGRSFIPSSYLALQVTQLHFHSILSITSTSQAHSNSRERTHTVFWVLCPKIVTYKVLDFERHFNSCSYSCFSSKCFGKREKEDKCAPRDAAVGRVGLILAPSTVLLASRVWLGGTRSLPVPLVIRRGNPGDEQ